MDRQAAGRALASARRRGFPLVCAAIACVGLAAGCAAGSPSEAAVRAATAFAAAVQSDPSAACELLAPVTRERLEQEGGANCPAALEQAGLSDPGRVLGSTVAGHSAQVRFADDAMFLALFDDGWKVVAVGCRRPSPDRAVPYECDVEGS